MKAVALTRYLPIENPASLEDVYVALVGEPHVSEAMTAVAA